MQQAASALGLQMLVLNGGTENDIDAAFATLTQQRIGALMIGADTFFTSQRSRIGTLAAQHRVPVFDTVREAVAAGGLISYGANLAGIYRQAGVYTGRILKGAKPADLPVLQSTMFR